MSKTKLLLNLAQDLRSLADSVQAVADVMADKETAEAAQPETPVSAKESEGSQAIKQYIAINANKIFFIIKTV